MKKTFSLTLDEENLEKVNIERRERDVSKSRTVNDALDFYFQYQDYHEILQQLEKNRISRGLNIKSFTKAIGG